MFDEVMAVAEGLVDHFANSERGHKMVDNIGSIIGRLFKNLTEEHGLSESQAALIIANLGRSTGSGSK